MPASDLKLALQCGGSDGFSGITANPALGVASDLLVRHGGTAILCETPEIYGAEHLLLRRAVSEEVGDKLLDLMPGGRTTPRKQGAEINNNPSPGNKAGGLTTILEKSLGAVAKGGSSDLVDVYRYAEPVTAQGFVFMDTPGYDPVSRPARSRAAPTWSASPPAAAPVRLQAGAVPEARHQLADVPAHGRGHGHQLRHDPRRRARRSRK